MKPVLSKPRYEPAEPALWFAGFSLFFLYLGAGHSALALLHLAAGLLCLLLAAGVWPELRAAVIAAAAVCALAALNFSVLKGLVLGSPVEIPETEISDWCYVRKDREPVGLFSLPALRAANKRQPRP